VHQGVTGPLLLPRPSPTSRTHSTFVSGMTASFLVAAVVAVGGALVALLVKKGRAGAPA
jgi:hypothetical protein